MKNIFTAVFIVFTVMLIIGCSISAPDSISKSAGSLDEKYSEAGQAPNEPVKLSSEDIKKYESEGLCYS